MLMTAGVVLIAMLFGGSIWSSGHLLTITKPVGGTISSAGIRCGTSGSDCSTTHGEGDAVELSAEPDAAFSFTGFTGDCAPTGRTAMTGPRTCSATFERSDQPPTSVVWPLTIKPPTGGTILAAGGIKCGVMGSECTTSIPNGMPVTLIAQADHGYTLSTFTDECAPTGITTMTGPRTCGATFTAVGSQDPPSPLPQPIPRTKREPVVRGLPSQVPAPAPTPVPPPGPVADVAPTGPPPVGMPPAAKDVITREEHATIEIHRIIKEYCAALQAIDPLRIRKIYPSTDVALFRDRYRQYKSVKCALTWPPEFVQLDADAGTAQVKVGVKQTQEMRSGGAPKVQETIASLTLVRPELRSFWHIRDMSHELKPKE